MNIEKFRKKYKNWSVSTDLVWHDESMSNTVFKCTLRAPLPKSDRIISPQVFTGWASLKDKDIRKCELLSIKNAFENIKE